ncbi:thioredoxin domain-containing protein [Catenulispora sp. NF23]|uniref:DsbA family protein n=1 Tax=Catenulispora pinistramenti TaxID=2705254 RepID=UPI001BAB8D21|nr:thioredoxin domain-containing protein [Catenulispora pinistramenti]MBS2537278.1 thioredoxin domain-containing protein [Catenulispora pinistramenti]
MSQANRVGKQNARERVMAEKIARQRAERRRKQWTIGGVVVVVIAVAGGVGIAVNAAKHDSGTYLAPVGAVVDPQAKSSKDLGIHVGSADAPVKMTVFEDFRCPVCQEIEGAVEPTYKQYVEAGKLQITYHPVRLIDSNNGGKGSLNGGNAAACAQDQGEFVPMHDLLYANQPNEETDGYGDNSKILSIADQVPALKVSTAFQTCVTKGQHDTWVQDNADQFNKLQLPGTPTMFIDGQQLTFGQQNQAAVLQYFQGQLDAAFKKDGSKAGTPTTLPTAPSSGASSSGAPSASGSSSGASSSSGAPSSSGSSSGTPSSTGSSSGSTPTSSKS